MRACGLTHLRLVRVGKTPSRRLRRADQPPDAHQRNQRAAASSYRYVREGMRQIPPPVCAVIAQLAQGQSHPPGGIQLLTHERDGQAAEVTVRVILSLPGGGLLSPRPRERERPPRSRERLRSARPAATLTAHGLPPFQRRRAPASGYDLSHPTCSSASADCPTSCARSRGVARRVGNPELGGARARSWCF